ncbi:MAG: hypothetical protein Ct9H300mP1_15970 [Planctomycetaceae bacterium]|nr:MAG: hypothetical protein Ct9H300mP1_15970 [Planctomycetaceae bacterium]
MLLRVTSIPGGDLDLVTNNRGDDGGLSPGLDDISVLLNNGDGTFAAQQKYSVDADVPYDVVLGDFEVMVIWMSQPIMRIPTTCRFS